MYTAEVADLTEWPYSPDILLLKHFIRVFRGHRVMLLSALLGIEYGAIVYGYKNILLHIWFGIKNLAIHLEFCMTMMSNEGVVCFNVFHDTENMAW